MPKIARVAAVVAFVLAGLSVLSALVNQLILLPFALIPLIAGLGIHRGRVWSAYGFGLYTLAQLLFVLLVLLRDGPQTALPAMAGLLFAAVFSVALACLYFAAGRSLAACGAKRGHAWPWIAAVVLLTCPLIFVQAYVNPTGSMEDTLLIGDHILVQRLPKPRMERDQVMVHRYPPDRHQTFIKRVIGIPGDRIRISHKIVYRNGSAVPERYALHKTDYEDVYRDNFPVEPNVHIPAGAREMLTGHVVNGEVVVPEGKYFVLGDNRDSSLDSRYWGFVDSEDVIGKPLLIYYSEDRPADLTGKKGWPRRVRWSRLFKML